MSMTWLNPPPTEKLMKVFNSPKNGLTEKFVARGIKHYFRPLKARSST